jgi:hypothetical protein
MLVCTLEQMLPRKYWPIGAAGCTLVLQVLPPKQ